MRDIRRDKPSNRLFGRENAEYHCNPKRDREDPAQYLHPVAFARSLDTSLFRVIRIHIDHNFPSLRVLITTTLSPLTTALDIASQRDPFTDKLLSGHSITIMNAGFVRRLSSTASLDLRFQDLTLDARPLSGQLQRFPALSIVPQKEYSNADAYISDD